MTTSIREKVSMATKQSSNLSKEAVPEQGYMSAHEALEKQFEQVKKLPDGKSWPFGYGPLILSVNAGLVGLIGNSFFRRMLKVRKGLFLTSVSSALIPALIMTPAWMKFVTSPILLEDLSCAVCADIRGGLINFLLGAAYPVILAAPISAALAKRYDTVNVPTVSIKNFNQRTFIDFWVGKTRYFKGQFITIAIFQTLFGMFIARSQMRITKEELSQKLVKVEH